MAAAAAAAAAARPAALSVGGGGAWRRRTRLLRVGKALLVPVSMEVLPGERAAFEADGGRLLRLAWRLAAEEAAALARAAGGTGVRKLLRHPDVLLVVEFVPNDSLRSALVSLPGREGAGRLPGAAGSDGDSDGGGDEDGEEEGEEENDEEEEDDEFEFTGDCYAPFRVASETMRVVARPAAALRELLPGRLQLG